MADELVRRSYSRRDKDAYESESDGELETEALFEEVAALEEKVQSWTARETSKNYYGPWQS